MTSGPTRGASETRSDRWIGRPGLARLLRIVIALVPVVTAFGVTRLLARGVPPTEVGVGALAYTIGLLAVAVVVAAATERLTRRLVPLTLLLQLSLIFPDQAPSRFGVALRSGSTKRLERRIREVQAGRLEVDPDTSTAALMLELVAALSTHDRLTRGHCERVRAYTDLVIDELRLPAEDADRLRWAALLHDVGKLRIPAEILNKKGRPTDREWEILTTHTLVGRILTEPMADWLGSWRSVVDQHHERWDGGGYPYGLAGTDIHLGARIVAVTDAYDVMTSARSYKRPMSPAAARREIARCAGSQFDPAVVRAFLNVGLGRLRVPLGPLTSVLNVPSTAAQQLSPVLAPIATGAAGVAAVSGAALGGLAPAPAEDPAEPPPAAIAFAEPIEALPLAVSVGETPSPATDDGGAGGAGADDLPQPPPTTTATPPTDADTGSGPDADDATPSPPPPSSPTTSTTEPGRATPTSQPPPPTIAAGRVVVAEDGVADEILTVAGDPTSVAVVAGPALGSAEVTLRADGVGLTYRPRPDVHGDDTLTVETCDAAGRCGRATIDLEITPMPDAPRVAPAHATVPLCADETIIDLSPHVTEVDGEAVEVVDVDDDAGDDLAEVEPEGGLLVEVEAERPGVVTVPYEVRDTDGDTATGQLTIEVTAPTLRWSTDTSPAQPDGPALAGATVSGSITSYVDLGCTDDHIEKAVFRLDGVWVRTEYHWTFSFGSNTSAEGPLKLWDTTRLPNGTHVMSAELHLDEGDTVTIEAAFTVAN